MEESNCSFLGPIIILMLAKCNSCDELLFFSLYVFFFSLFLFSIMESRYALVHVNY